MSGRFSYVAYDATRQKQQQAFKGEFEKLEAAVNRLRDGRAKSLVYTKLEEAYMWVGKAIRDAQVAAGGSAAELPARSDDLPTLAPQPAAVSPVALEPVLEEPAPAPEAEAVVENPGTRGKKRY